ncbi:MAG: glycoside hydrolase family 3 N-terminal domain-containing protein [Candidatus Binatia bacterium]|nr:glycoside hydrolase family 3 N-terminal domain-containing protein [Candidatus Binatia bacterium]
MRRLKWIWMGLLCLVGFLVVVALIAWASFEIQDYRARAALGPAAPKVSAAGRSVRDLNRNGRVDPYEDPTQPLERRVEDLLGQMNIAEKVGLMFQPPIFLGSDGHLVGNPFQQGFSTVDAVALRQFRAFNIVNAGSPREMAAWNNRLQEMAERSRLGIPVTISSDPRHGLRDEGIATSVRTEGFSLWPEPIGLAATGDAALVRQFGEIANLEYRAVGIRLALHPMADLATEPRWARIVGSFGEDAELSAKMTHAYVLGFQGESLGEESVACMTKHFPGGGPQADGWDAHFSYGGDQAYPGDNFDYHLIPFEAALDAGTAQMMPYYGVPVGQTSEDVAMGFNREILTDLLREKYGFDGVVCADWGIVAPLGFGPIEMVHAKAHGVWDLTIPERYVKALDAGIDQFGGQIYPEPLIELVESGKVPESRIDVSVRRLLRDKFRLGLFDDPYVDVERAGAICGNPEFMAAGEIAQRKSIILLQNEVRPTASRATLPLARDVRVYVEGFDPSIVAGYATVAESLEDADFALVRTHTPYEPAPAGNGIGDRIFGAIFNQGALDYRGDELERLQKIAATRPTVLAIYLERPAVLTNVAEKTSAILAHFGATDEALLDVAFGRFAPTAKLPFELPSSMQAVEAQSEDVPYDSDRPLFPFGFGLSYDANPEAH